MYACGTGGAPADVLRTLVGLSACCQGATQSPTDCICWVPEYDLDQQPPIPGDHLVTEARSTACEDCAYRPNSPERQGDEAYVADFDSFDAGVFYCHQGMRKPLRWRHQGLGIVVEATGDYYAPPMRIGADGNSVPFKADGTPGDRCAGWAAQRRAEGRPFTDYATESQAELEAL